ncbi:MAG: hypothetical protein MK207_05290 [Saprospiraceae bacterium]|nr:hypothetical protein [Saprospiraceae bacterium]
MTTSEFNILFKDPGQLSDLSYEILDKLLLQSPYCNGIHMLLLKKYKIDKHISYERYLGMASMYASDRTKLYNFLNTSAKLKNKVVAINKEISQEQIKTNLKTKLIPPPPVFIHKVSKNPPVFVVEDSSEVADDTLLSTEPEVDKDDISLSTMPIEEWLNNFEPPRIIQNKKPVINKKGFKLSRVPLFDNDIFDFLEKESSEKEIHNKVDKIKQKSKNKKQSKNIGKKKKHNLTENKVELSSDQIDDKPNTEDIFDLFLSKTDNFIKSIGDRENEEKIGIESWEDNSTDENEDIVSETLADLLVLQGQKDKAIKMYRTLSLKFPEKSRYFAEKIEELNS